MPTFACMAGSIIALYKDSDFVNKITIFIDRSPVVGRAQAEGLWWTGRIKRGEIKI